MVHQRRMAVLNRRSSDRSPLSDMAELRGGDPVEIIRHVVAAGLVEEVSFDGIGPVDKT